MYRVKDLFHQHGESLGLELVAGGKGMSRRIKVPEAQRPGLSLAGYLKGYAEKRILIFGKMEIGYLRDLDKPTRIKRLSDILALGPPAVIVARRYKPLPELRHLCEQHQIPLFRASMTTMSLIGKLTLLITEEFAPKSTYQGTLVEVFGVGVLIQGDSSVGKSEAALGLIECGHRLISDDIVNVRVRESTYLEGSGGELTRHHMEIRGIGIINVAYLYGAICVRTHKAIEMVVKLEVWDDEKHYDRVGAEEQYYNMLGIDVPFYLLPVKPGRDVVLLIETLALNHRLKGMGYNSAKEFNNKLIEEIQRKTKAHRARGK